MTEKKKAAEKTKAERDAEAAARADAEAEAAEEALADANQTSEFATGDGAGPAPEDRLAALEAEAASLKDQLLRALAEAENTRRRAERDRGEAAKYGAVALARDLLSVADNLRRALEALPEDARRDGADWAKDLITGVELIEKDFLDAFARHGIAKLEPVGESFDHNFHQAMFELEDPEKPAGTVVQLMQPGYRLHDRLLRAAMVGVSKGGPKPAKPASAEDAAGNGTGDGAPQGEAK
ncbi:MAG: nucleotide exchange factor GrpE [Alphaproteobacteria bacterium]|nr:nucleotide exchange factor GrpE [Alphaproteobacteria bacterium]